MDPKELIEHKETTLKLAEPLKLKAVPFSKGYKVEITLNMDPNNSIHLDSLSLPLEKSTVRRAVADFIQIIETDLGGVLLKDD